MKASKVLFIYVFTFMSFIFLSSSSTCSAAVEKKWNQNLPEKFTMLSEWDVKVENAMVQYIKGEDGTLQPGYLGDDGIFYLFSDIAVLNGSEYTMTDEAKNARLVDKPDKIVKIKRPRPYHRILWENGSYYPACHCDADNIFFVFLGFGHLNESKRDSGNPRGGVEPYEYDFEKKEIIGIATQEPIVLVQGPAKKRAKTDENLPPISPKQSIELERILKESEKINEFVKKTPTEHLLSNLAAALDSNDADIRYHAMKYLYSNDSVENERILPFIQDVFKKMVKPDGEVVDIHDGDESWHLTKLFAKYPDPNSIPILCHLAKKSWQIPSPLIGANNRKISFLDDIVYAVRVCSDYTIGKIPVGWSSFNMEKRTKLADEWLRWYKENKSKEDKKQK